MTNQAHYKVVFGSAAVILNIWNGLWCYVIAPITCGKGARCFPFQFFLTMMKQNGTPLSLNPLYVIRYDKFIYLFILNGKI